MEQQWWMVERSRWVWGGYILLNLNRLNKISDIRFFTIQMPNFVCKTRASRVDREVCIRPILKKLSV